MIIGKFSRGPVPIIAGLRREARREIPVRGAQGLGGVKSKMLDEDRELLGVH